MSRCILENSLDGRELGIKSLSGLETATNLQTLSFNSNEISDLTPLTALPRLRGLYVQNNFLSAASIHEHIPALQSRGVEVKFSFLHLFTERESPFDIESVFLDDFTVEQQELWYRMARRWESALPSSPLTIEQKALACLLNNSA